MSKSEQTRYEVRLKGSNTSSGQGAFSLGKFFDWTGSIFWSRVLGSMSKARVPGRGYGSFFSQLLFNGKKIENENVK